MDDTVLLSNKMEKLRMKGMLMTYDQRLRAARDEHWSYSAFLDTLLTDEVEQRNHAHLTSAI